MIATAANIYIYIYIYITTLVKAEWSHDLLRPHTLWPCQPTDTRQWPVHLPARLHALYNDVPSTACPSRSCLCSHKCLGGKPTHTPYPSGRFTTVRDHVPRSTCLPVHYTFTMSQVHARCSRSITRQVWGVWPWPWPHQDDMSQLVSVFRRSGGSA